MLLHRLCAALGVLHPDHLQAQLTNPQIADWIAYQKLEPFGPHMDAWYHARLLADLRNYSQMSRKRDWKVADFMPKPPPAEQPLGQKIRAALSKLKRQPSL